MAAWFTANGGTILVSLILMGAVTRIILNMRKRRKQGESSCGCGCAHCAMRGTCHQK